jgi:glycosyltransferase involved in cell wall biosynthesis
MREPSRILYAIGPGDSVESYRRWKAGERMLSETSKTFSGHFYDYCARRGLSAYVVSSHGAAETLRDGRMLIENRPKPGSGPGLRYHLAQLRYGMSLIATALQWKADTVIVDSGTTHWPLLGLLRLAGIRVVAILHNALWPSGFRPERLPQRVLLALDRWFWRNVPGAVMAVSPECERQVRELAGVLRARVAQFRAQFDAAEFASVPPPRPWGDAPLRIMFAGRVERNKGALDIATIARALERRMPGRAVFDVCGAGSALDELRQALSRGGLEGVVRVHGRLNRPRLLEVYARSHAVIVPTRSDFCEGMPMVCAEAILCGRPVITTRLSNALDVLPGALVIATPDDPASYADAILDLLADPERYARHREACERHRAQFLDPAWSLEAALESVLGS